MSFALTHLIGFGAMRAAAARGASSNITAGSNIGDMTETGGLAAAFDGNTAQAYSASATKTTTPGYVGKTFSGACQIDYADVTGSSNSGVDGNSGATTITLTLYAKSGSAPASATDGTQLATVTQADANGTTVRLTSTDNLTYYDHAWVRFATTGANSCCSELVIFGWS